MALEMKRRGCSPIECAHQAKVSHGALLRELDVDPKFEEAWNAVEPVNRSSG